MKTSYKLAIVAIAVLAVAWCAYTIYKNSQPQPKQAIELNEVKKEINQNSPQPTQQPETTPTNTEPQTTQKSVTQPTEQPQIAEVVPAQQTGGVEISNVTQATSYTAMVGSDKITYCDLVFSDSTTQRIKVLTIHPSQDGITIGGQYFCSQWIGTSKTKIAAHFQ